MLKRLALLAMIAACQDPAAPARRDPPAVTVDARVAPVVPDEGAKHVPYPMPPQRTDWPTSPTGDCSTKYAPNPDRDAAPMCRIAGGKFMFGEGGKLPPQTVTLTEYFIDQFEVTAEQYVRFLTDVGNDCGQRRYRDGQVARIWCVTTQEIIGPNVPLPIGEQADGFVVRPGFEGHPAGGVGIEGARRYCEWAGKRLPTEPEWELVATVDRKTGKKRRLPWGDGWQDRTANCAESPHHDEEVCADGHPRTAPIGSFPRGASTWGPQDLIGNVSEWIADCSVGFDEHDGPPCGARGCKDPPPRTACGDSPVAVVRGDDFSASRIDAMWRSTLVDGFAPGRGFRCAFRSDR